MTDHLMGNLQEESARDSFLEEVLKHPCTYVNQVTFSKPDIGLKLYFIERNDMGIFTRSAVFLPNTVARDFYTILKNQYEQEN